MKDVAQSSGSSQGRGNSWRVGVDSGGTFTDVCLFDEASGEISVWKVASTPDDPSRGIAQGVDEGLTNRGLAQEDRTAAVAYLGHGTTVATNALITGAGAKLGLITTDGFRDLLEIGRQKRPDLYDLFAGKPTTLVPRELRFGVAERVLHTGEVATELDEDAVRAAAREMREKGVGSVAICFLYSFVNPAHEKAARAIVAQEMPDAFICASHEIAPEFREFERLSTATVNAYLGPIMSRYISRLSPRFVDMGVTVAPHLTQSNGGVVRFDAAAESPVRAVLSGPSTGVVAARAIGTRAGFDDIITFDMGGTSSDVALMAGGDVAQTNESTVHGYPIKAPMLDIHTVGAGGGSIASIDSGGLLKVGPESAGADPGPVCYGRGATRPTVTDANIVLQILNPTHLLDGRMKVRRDLAVEAIGQMAEKLGMGLEQTAQGILSVVSANMAKAIRVVSVQRGHDPRAYALMAFGGAGPLHAVRLAQELGMAKVIVPRNPGILCAMGLLLTDLRADFATTRLLPLEPEALSRIAASLDAVDAEGAAWFEDEEIAPEDRRTARRIDMRYEGQNHELAIAVPDGPLDGAALDQLKRAFDEVHTRRYGFAVEGERINCVTFRLEATGVVQKAALPEVAEGPADASGAVTGAREVWYPETGAFTETALYARDRLHAGMAFNGPAIVEQMDTTTLIPPGVSVRVDTLDNLILELGK
ncbi:hydantoinase/oxoprolinase family protein [Oceaniovalibus sp. ACAM 378]|uniref:hydantoinase/oxoprolinase family protein n=1 Tax=Oceaniovalibus sp. ACAM 378 TaxID=2599923 RepID=UPI0011D5F878|nr:hydantoinase/oxoprolinase family protein [Oceaniovalibus sp. ACAM 378]TYB90197.1 hydantoinase/oxoprolinase family protein [Oceaniovalibus sp. ACAM 378]